MIPKKNYLIELSLLTALSFSILEGQNFYPLQVGNRWHYFDWSWGRNDTSFTTVTSDSAFPNGHHYFVLSRADLAGGIYLRTDSQFVYYFRQADSSDVPLLSLKAHVGDTAHVSWDGANTVICDGIDTENVFGTQTRILEFSLSSYGLSSTSVNLAENFGPYHSEVWDDDPNEMPLLTRELIGAVIGNSTFGYVTSVKVRQLSPSQFVLALNYPNPFNPSTTLSFQIPEQEDINLQIFDILGRPVRKLLNGQFSNGQHSVSWDGKNDIGAMAASGVYFCVLRAKEGTITRSMLLLH